MSEGFPYSDIVILALLAGLVLLRLRAVLGQKIGQEPPPLSGFARGETQTPVVQIASSAAKGDVIDEDAELMAAIVDKTTVEALAAIKKADPQFGLRTFLEGAKSAFDMVFESFLKNDRDTMKMLLAPALFELFSAEMDRRKTAETRRETTLLALISQEVTQATLEKNLARIRVRFVSEQVSVERDAKNTIVAGDPSHSQHVEDEWTFERDLTSRNPNWKIIET